MSASSQAGTSAGPRDAEPAPATPRYIGLLTRGIAFAIDAALINIVALIVGVAEALILSLLHLPSALKTILVVVNAGVYFLWTAGYFVVFWSTTGQTPGDRALGFRVVAVKGERLKPRRSALRFLALLACAIPLMLGFVPILFDRRRRGLHDRAARTLVIDAPGTSIAQQRMARRREAGSSDSGDARSGPLQQA